MRGSIQKKGKVYYAVIPINGKRKWYRGGTRKDAQKKLIDILKELKDGTYKEMPKITFNEFADLWLKSYAEVSLKESSLSAYRSMVNGFLKPAFGHLILANITTGNFQAYIAERLNHVSAQTVGNEVMIIKMMFKHAFRWGYTKSNLAEYVDRPKVQRKEIEILNPEEVNQLLDKVEDSYRVAFLTDVITGLRAGELWGLQWGDIDWNSKQLYVRRSLWRNKFQTPKSKCSIRTVDIPDSLIHELRKWKLACPISEDDLVFPGPTGNLSGHAYAVRRYFNSALRSAGLRRVRFHSLRHTNASMRIHAGQNIKYISTQLGHSSIRITLDIYGHLFNDANFNRQQANLLDISFQSVRNPLEKTQVNVNRDSNKIPKSLILNVNG